MARRQHGWMPVEITHKGRAVEADYCILNRAKGVTVATRRSCRSRECDGLPPEIAAQKLLRELVEDGLA